MANRLRHEYKALYLQTHVAENTDEVAWVAELFPDRRSYLDVYEHYGLVGERSIYAHCIHLDSTDRKLIADRGASMAFCPTSNLFLGSGLFDLDSALFNNIKVGVATDVGGGTSFSILQTLNEAYKVSQMSGQTLTSMKAFYLATLGGAKALSLDHKLGNFELDKEADFVVLDLESTPLMERRMDNSDSIQDKLFALMMLGDDRAVHATFVMGVCRFKEGRSICQD
jgi:guanine deaminase